MPATDVWQTPDASSGLRDIGVIGGHWESAVLRWLLSRAGSLAAKGYISLTIEPTSSIATHTTHSRADAFSPVCGATRVKCYQVRLTLYDWSSIQ